MLYLGRRMGRTPLASQGNRLLRHLTRCCAQRNRNRLARHFVTPIVLSDTVIY